jgi:hypothetical protein
MGVTAPNQNRLWKKYAMFITEIFLYNIKQHGGLPTTIFSFQFDGDNQ